ncbi:tetratricopeptide repeat protein [Bacteroidetes/Chlorobi group bacterium ChocPot_Mid]|nr:MAG: tetratricopeptide repeat protein [Bacteroidetes/Chlorobi group bacterium ChocPot_Mid]
MNKQEDYLYLAYKRFADDEDELAKAYFLAAIEDDPYNSEIYYFLSYICEKKQNYIDAIEYLEKAIDLNPKAEYFSRLAYIKEHKTHDVLGALEDLNTAIELAPTKYFYVFDRFNLYWKLLMYDEIFKDLDLLIERDPWNKLTTLLSLRAVIEDELLDSLKTHKDI